MGNDKPRLLLKTIDAKSSKSKINGCIRKALQLSSVAATMGIAVAKRSSAELIEREQVLLRTEKAVMEFQVSKTRHNSRTKQIQENRLEASYLNFIDP